tara:strand:+ start:10628 stop:11557 length:930 start_codon:yes stop_codon:yes gene_type:complete
MLQPVWVLGVVMLIENLLNWPERYHPLSFVRLVADRMADKVHPSAERPALQQQISGTLAPLVLISPIAVILAIFTSMAEFPLFFDGVLLLVALQYQPILDRAKKVQNALSLHKKVLARQTLAPMVLRETASLSEVGIIKACIESVILRFHQQYLFIILVFLVFGPVVALSLRLLYEFSHSWNVKLKRFSIFGQPCANILALWLWLPVRISASLCALIHNISGAFKALRALPSSSSTHQVVLALQGGALGIQLSGPIIYDQNKKRSTKCGGPNQASIQDINRSLQAITLCKLTYWVLSLCIAVTISSLAQ